MSIGRAARKFTEAPFKIRVDFRLEKDRRSRKAVTRSRSESSSAGSGGLSEGTKEPREEMSCDRCGDHHGVIWFAPSDIWNAVMREGDQGNPDEYPFCCPICFMQLAEERGIDTTGWLVCPFDDGPVDRAEQIVFAAAGTKEPHVGRAFGGVSCWDCKWWKEYGPRWLLLLRMRFHGWLRGHRV